MQSALPVLLMLACAIGLAMALLIASWLFNPHRASQVTRMPYESGMDPIHDTRRRFDVRFHLLAIAFLVFDVELLFLYPWAVVAGSERQTAWDGGRACRMADGDLVQQSTLAAHSPAANAHATLRPAARVPRSYFFPAMAFLLLLAVGYVYLWRKGVFRWE